MKRITFLLIAFILVHNAFASDEKGKDTAKEQSAAPASCSLKGKVYDPVCREAVSGATVTVDGIKYYSDLSGDFYVSELNKGKHTICVDFISYQSQAMEIDLDTNRELNIELKQQ
ncbi:MAG: carboxypeptidase-like regulatory domain-containing protein [Tannerellaceae bacterium]|jgi:hypothetical protein|nr:carboxypeptidase-like regulatory domain-containing protein [Tannerellaceae bacterium]